MVRTTERLFARRPWSPRSSVVLALALILTALMALSGCTGSAGSQGTGSSKGSAEATTQVSAHMAGPPTSVYVSLDVVKERKPQPWDLSTPESAVRSYLAWVSYAYRIGDSQVATPTMSATEEVSMDSYCQYNVEKKRLLDETLTSIKFGNPSKTATATLLPAQESWTYRYLSVGKGNAVIEGPYDIKYQSVYTVVKNGQGNWVVDSVNAKAQGTVK